MGKEARNNGHQLFERPKKQCLKFLADYATQQQLYFQALTLYEARATGRHLQTDLLARLSFKRQRKSEERAVFQ